MAVDFNDLIIIMEKLRSPEGCPWEKASGTVQESVEKDC